jgi:monofunctional biosynthetic peptidoglycan transglycosylase
MVSSLAVPRRRKPSALRRAALATAALALAAAAAASALWVALPDPSPLARENPRTTALIERRRAEARQRRRPFQPRQSWIGLDRVTPRLVQSVLLSEDANFFGHDGIDWEAVRDAAEHDLRARRFARGASTLTQQLAKNLWLGPEKTLWRKAKEAVLAAKLERAVSKKRILALYLNVVEMDDAVFGVEAGARHRFGTSAADLSLAQAVVLASTLPAPRRVDLAQPSSWLRQRSRRLLDRMRDFGRVSAEEHLRASTELERILAGPRPIDDRAEPPEDDEVAASGGSRSRVGSADPGPPHPAPPRGPPAMKAASPQDQISPLPRLVPGEREISATSTETPTEAETPTSTETASATPTANAAAATDR